MATDADASTFDFSSMLQDMAPEPQPVPFQQQAPAQSSPSASQSSRHSDTLAHNSITTRSSSLLGKTHSSAVNAVAAAAAAGSPLGNARKRGSKQPQGKQLADDAHLEYQVDRQTVGPPRLQLEAAPVTVYATEATLELRQFVTANSSYICYGLKNGQVRVLHRITGGKALLRGHTAPVIDLSFFPGSQDLLASSGKDRQLIVWRLSGGSSASLTGQQVLAVQLPPGGAPTEPRLAWHPTCANILFFTAGSRVLVAHVGEVAASAPQVDLDVNALPEGVACLPSGGGGEEAISLTAVAISTDGYLLAASGSNGVIHVWQLPHVTTDTARVSPLVGNMALLPSLRPTRQPTGSLVWTSLPTAEGAEDGVETKYGSALLAGNESNSEITLFAAAPQSSGSNAGDRADGLQQLQTLRLVSSAGSRIFTHMQAVPAAGLALLASATSPAVYAIQLTGGNTARGPGFAAIAEFAVKSPMLTVAAVVDHDSEGAPLALFAVQATAVQQFALDPALCAVPSDGDASRSVQSSATQHDASLASTSSPQPVPSSSQPLHQQPSNDAPGPAPSVSISPAPPQEPQAAAAAAAAAVPAPLPQRSTGFDSQRADSSGSNGGADGVLPAGISHQSSGSSSSSVVPEAHLVARQPAALNGIRTHSDDAAAPGVSTPFATRAHHGSATTDAPVTPAAASPRLLTPKDLMPQVMVGPISLGATPTDATAPPPSLGNAVNGAGPPPLSPDPSEVEKGMRMMKRARASAPSPAASTDAAAAAAAARPASAPADALSSASVAAILQAQTESQKRLVGHLNANFRDVLKAMRSELSKETRRMEAAMDARLASALAASSAQYQAEREAAAAKSAENLNRMATALSQGLNQSLPLRVEECVRREMSNMAAGVGAVVAPAVRAAIAQTPLQQAQPALPAPKAVDSQEVADRLQVGLTGPLSAALHAAVKRQLLPPMEAAIREGFRQMDVSLGVGFREHAQAGTVPFATTAESLQAVLTQATELNESMKGELAEGHRQLLDAAAAAAEAVTVATSATTATQAAQLEAAPDPTIEISALVHDERYEEAFTKVLGLANVGLVTWLCCQLDPSILSQEPVVLSQGVLLSLLQQLGSGLADAPSQVLFWIRDAALALDPQSPQLAGHMLPVLEELFAALQARSTAVASASDGSAAPSEAAVLRLVIHIVNSLRMQCS